MRLAAMIVGAMLVLGLSVAPSHADKRVALVIGNGAYQNLRQLPNPPNDASDLAAALTSHGFEVDLGIDLRLPEMQRKVTEFARRARGADVALAFFAGHGVQAPDPLGSAQSVNYLLPIEADIKDAVDLGFLLSARDIVARLQRLQSCGRQLHCSKELVHRFHETNHIQCVGPDVIGFMESLYYSSFA